MFRFRESEISGMVLAGVLGSALLLPVVAGNALAQTREGYGIEEIVVVAQKRAENLQSVPISVAAMTAQTLAKYGVDNSPLDLQMVTPGLQTTQVVSGFAPRIRAIGSTDSTPGNESSVSVYVDGVYIPGPASGLVSLSNIERVEVLKGPQGTLFGRNTTGGLIQVITKDPSQETGGNLSVSYDKYDTKTVKGYATTGLGENVAADLAGRWEDQGDSWGTNIYDGQDAYRVQNRTFRSKVLVTPGENTTITLTGDYYKYKNHVAPFRLEIPSDFYDYNQDLNSKMTGKVWGVSGRVEHEFEFGTLVAISAYRNLNQDTSMDIDLGPTFFQHAFFESYGKSFSQEIQLLSPDSSEIDWIVGAFYFDRKAAFDPVRQEGAILQMVPPPLPPLSALEAYNKQKTTSYALFAQATYPLLENTNLTLGIRYTDDKQDFDGYGLAYPLPGIPNLPPVLELPELVIPDNLNSDKLNYRIVLDYHFTADIMAYVSYNTGYKSGYFNISGFPADSAGPESLEAYEIGIKSELFDNRLRLNASAYHYDFNDVQSIFIVQGAARAINAGSAKVNGVEAEVTAAPVANWNVNLGFNWMPEADYSTFYPCPGPQNPPWGPANYNCSDSRMINAPKWDVTLGTDYTIPSSIGDFNLAVAYQYMSSFPWDANFGIVPGYNTGLYKEPSHSFVNVKAAWTSPREEFNLAVWAKNLTDEEHLVNGNQSSGSGQIGMPGRPRTYGMTIGYQF